MIASILALILLLGGPAENLRFTKFTYHDFDRGELSTATVTFRRGETEVDLVSVVHIADSAYYQEIQRELNSCDLVFYELVSGSSPEALSSLSALQLSAGDILQLSFQMTEIDYGPPHFVHSDLSWPEIEKMIEGSPLPPVPKDNVLEKFIPQLRRGKHEATEYFADNPALRRSIKVFLGQLLGDIPSFLKQLNVGREGDSDDILVSARNRRALEVLSPHVQGKKRLALFWGAAHMPDFAQRLKRLGFEPVELRWHLAWRIGEIDNRRWY